MPRLARTSPANVSRPSHIHGRRQIGTITAAGGRSIGSPPDLRSPHPTTPDAPGHSHPASMRSSDASASRTVVGAVNHTANAAVL